MEIVQKKEKGEVKNHDTKIPIKVIVFLKCHKFTVLEKCNLRGICTFFLVFLQVVNLQKSL